MASLALFASIIFISVILIGPLTYILSLFTWMPKMIVWILGLGSIIIGIWWMLLPIPAIKYYGLVDIFCGYKALSGTNKKTTQG